MNEPEVDDPAARGLAEECEDCGNYIHACECNEPDRMYGDED